MATALPLQILVGWWRWNTIPEAVLADAKNEFQRILLSRLRYVLSLELDWAPILRQPLAANSLYGNPVRLQNWVHV